MTAYCVYVNEIRKKARIHKETCVFSRPGGNPNANPDNSAWYGGYSTYSKAETKAKGEAIRLKTKVTNCKVCNPQSVKS